MAASSEQTEISLISRGSYRLVSDVIGPECHVKLRRNRYELFDRLLNCDTNSESTRITGGSTVEGFEFMSSDFDFIFVNREVSVVTNSILSYNHNLTFPILFVMESEECYPGYTLLRCLKCVSWNILLCNALVLKANNLYVSGKVIKETFMPHSFAQEHGPCKSFKHYIEIDMAYTLRCPVWPTQAMSFVTRSIERGWPSYQVLKDVMNDGCLLVPISSKQQTCSDLVDLEWRISFSLAEKRLIYSMNHSQFLCYGLSKIFLNEILKDIPVVDDLLCSYFMKTAVLWEISDSQHGWSQETILYKFWNVFRRLLKWVSIGYCPNFFIPENNMFYGKICGENQQTLITVLCQLYSEGYRCLLRCSSLHEDLSFLIRQPRIALKMRCNEEEYVPVSTIEREKLLTISTSMYSKIPITDYVNRMGTILKNTINLHIDSEEMLDSVRLRVNYHLQSYAQYLLLFVKCSHAMPINNRKLYQSTKTAQAILSRTKTYFCMNYIIYANDLYMTGKYHKAIDMLHYIKHRLHSQPYMYIWDLDDDIIKDTRQQGMPYDILIKSFILDTVKVDSFTSMGQLQLECHAKVRLTGLDYLNIPLFVHIDFLLFLSYSSLEENQRRYAILEELHDLVYYDNGYHIHNYHKAISWEILGICQQICGDCQGALKSYRNALNEEENFFKEATLTRIQSLFIQS